MTNQEQLDKVLMEYMKEHNIPSAVEAVEHIIRQLQTKEIINDILNIYYNYCSILTPHEKEYLKLKYC